MLHQSMLSLSRLSRRSLVGRAGALAATLSLSARSTRAAQEATPTARPASPTPEGQFANINGAELYYVLEGPEDGPPVLLLHGGIGNTEEFRNVAPALVAAGYRTIAFDQRGRGRSTWGDQPITYEQMAADTVAVLDKLGIERTDVIGWSDGGIVALELAVTHPERLKRVVAYGANSRPEGSYAEPQMSDQMPPFEDFIADYQRLSPAPERFEELLGVLGDLYKVAPNFTDADLEGITVPVLILDGAQEEFVKPEDTKRMGTLIPGAELVVIPDTGHFAPFARPEEFNRIVLAFLAG
ncbi:MAG: alpha/beta hydrolase [Thermomicrobiales bacterium]